MGVVADNSEGFRTLIPFMIQHFLTAAAMAGFLSIAAAETPPAPVSPAGTTPDTSGTALHGLPFHIPGKIEGDPLFFVQPEGETMARAVLIHLPEEIPVIRSSTLEITYEPGKDFTWQPGSREILLTAGSRIPFKTAAELHPAPDSPQSYRACRDGKSWMLYGEGRFFHDLQSVASYSTKASWQGPVPVAAPLEHLLHFRGKLLTGKPVKLVTLGDSISTGANASGSVGAPPMQAGYPDLVADGIAQRFGVMVGRKNLSVSGMDSAWGLTQIPTVLAELPDVVLLAFGMNDASGRRTTEEFVKIMQELTHRIQTARPGCAVILVSPMTANPEWTHAQPEMYPAYAAGLKTLTGPERALADVTAVWLGVLQQKSYLCLSGNGLNHPNDFGHRLYAEVVLETIGGK